MGSRKRITTFYRIMSYQDIDDDFEEKMHEIYLGYGKYVMAKPNNITWNETLQVYLVDFRYNPKDIYTK